MRWRPALAGLAASLVGVGLARFAYTPLIPALIGAHWFTPSTVVYFGAANLLGYLIGALAARRLLALASAPALLRMTMALASASFFASAVPLSIGWYFAWRLASGIAGGVVMVLAPPVVLASADPARRGLVGGLIFTGVGLGIAASGTLVPLLLRHGLPATWCGLGAVSAVLMVLAWTWWPDAGEAPGGGASVGRRGVLSVASGALLLAYGLNAFGLVPHMVFLVDFIARGLGRGLAVGAAYWVLFGAGALVGPLLAGTLADRVGFGPALRIVLGIEVVVVALPAVSVHPAWLAVSATVAGAATPGVVPLVLGRVQDLFPGDPNAQRVVWSLTTTVFALFMAGGANFDAFLFAHDVAYRTLFGLGAGALGAALAIDLAAARLARKGRGQTMPVQSGIESCDDESPCSPN